MLLEEERDLHFCSILHLKSHSKVLVPVSFISDTCIFRERHLS